ncbi:hypothetical protein Tco_1573963, partial [Tanacetum coccineum]
SSQKKQSAHSFFNVKVIVCVMSLHLLLFRITPLKGIVVFDPSKIIELHAAALLFYLVMHIVVNQQVARFDYIDTTETA